MTPRMRWLLSGGVALIAIAMAVISWPPVDHPPAIPVMSRSMMRRVRLPATVGAPMLTPAQLTGFLTAARRAEAIPDLLQRCLRYPDPPGLAWSKNVTDAYCHYQFDPWVTPNDARELIQGGQAAELDKRLAEAMHAQLSQPGMQGALDRTFNLDFKDGSEENRGLMDAWKRQLPKSAFALAASGTAYVEMAQRIRGSKYAAKNAAGCPGVNEPLACQRTHRPRPRRHA